MIDKVKYLEIDEIKYPYFCSLNTLEQIQDVYGSITEWEDMLSGKNKSGEISVTDLKQTFQWMLIEGMEIEESKMDMPDLKQVGRIIAREGLQVMLAIVKRQVLECIYGKNLKAAPSQQDPEKTTQK